MTLPSKNHVENIYFCKHPVQCHFEILAILFLISFFFLKPSPSFFYLLILSLVQRKLLQCFILNVTCQKLFLFFSICAPQSHWLSPGSPLKNSVLFQLSQEIPGASGLHLSLYYPPGLTVQGTDVPQVTGLHMSVLTHTSGCSCIPWTDYYKFSHCGGDFHAFLRE